MKEEKENKMSTHKYIRPYSELSKEEKLQREADAKKLIGTVFKDKEGESLSWYGSSRCHLVTKVSINRRRKEPIMIEFLCFKEDAGIDGVSYAYLQDETYRGLMSAINFERVSVSGRYPILGPKRFRG